MPLASPDTNNFNTAGPVCYRTNQTINGWGLLQLRRPDAHRRRSGPHLRRDAPDPVVGRLYCFSVTGGTFRGPACTRGEPARRDALTRAVRAPPSFANLFLDLAINALSLVVGGAAAVAGPTERPTTATARSRTPSSTTSSWIPT
jgi:hypothetical protein